MYRLVCFLIFFIALCEVSMGQPKQIFIQGEYYKKPLVEFIHEMEQEHNVRFYYTGETVNEVTLSGIFRYKTPLREAFTKLLEPTTVSFYFNDDGSVVLFRDKSKKGTVPDDRFFKLTGQISDKSTQAPLPFATAYIHELSKGAVSDEHGLFEIKPLVAGTYQISFSYVGYQTFTQHVTLNSDKMIDVTLDEMPIELKEVVITPGAFEISTLELAPFTLGKDEILHSPNFAKDIYRTLRTLPGLASTDFSAKARIRGGHSEEAALYLDHFQINQPFHLEEIDGSFSIFNTDYVEEMKVLTGGFPVKYTDKLSGIIDVRSSDLVDFDEYNFSVDLLNAGVFVKRKLTEKSNVFVMARRGYLDLLIRKFETISEADHLQPEFYDIWSKVTLEASEKHRLSFNVLFAQDNFEVEEAASNLLSRQLLHDKRNNVNTWINWKWFPTSKFQSVTTLGYQGNSREADFYFMENLLDDNTDHSDTKNAVLTQSNYWDINDRHSLEFGIDLKHFWTSNIYREIRYDLFHSTAENILTDSIFIDNDFNGYLGAGYVQHSLKLGKKIIVQPGLRVSIQSFSNQTNWSPRLNLLYHVSESITARLGYGIYYQPDLYFRLRTSLGQSKPFSTNSKSIHYTGSVQYTGEDVDVQVSAYYKDYQKLYDDYRFEYFNRLGTISILDKPFNTASGRSKGLEIMARKNYGKRNLVSVAYAYAVNEITSGEGEKTFRDFDQPHAIIVNNVFRLPYQWNISLLWRYHTGHPFTPVSVSFIGERETGEGNVLFYETGKKNSLRLPDTHSFDIRFEKSWSFKKSRLTVYVNIVNFYGHKNVRNYWWDVYRDRSSGNLMAERRTQINIPFFISPGVNFSLR